MATKEQSMPSDRTTEMLLFLTVTWLAFGLPMEFFYYDLAYPLGPLVWLTSLMLYATAAVIVLVWIATAWRASRWRWHLAAAISFGAGAFFLLVEGREIATRSYFARHRSGWLADISDPYGRGQSDRLLGRPIYAFRMGAGLIDNWCAIVRDESGEIERVNEFEWGDPAAEPWRKLFDGDLVACRSIEFGWYVCCFT